MWWLFAIAAIALSLFSWWTYRYLSNQPVWYRFLLTFLRSSSLILLLLVVWNPSYRKEEVRQKKKSLAILLDNSESVSINRGKYDGPAVLKNLNQFINSIDTGKVRLRLFDNRGLVEESIDRLFVSDSSFTATTNLEQSLQNVISSPSPHDQILLFSDGIFNQGRDPLFLAQSTGIPIHSVALGDTSDLRDLAVGRIDVPSVIYRGNEASIKSEISVNGAGGERTTIRLKIDGKEVQQKRIRIRKGQKTIQFDVKHRFLENGTYPLEIAIDGVRDEFSLLNNRSSIQVRVEENQRRILLINNIIHPDIKAISKSLAQSEANRVYSLTMDNNGRPMGSGQFPDRTDTLDAIIIFGHPKPATVAERQILQLIQDVPALWVLSSAQQPQAFNSYQTPISFDRFSGYRQSRLNLSERSASHAIIDNNIPDWRSLGTLSVPIFPPQPNPFSEVILVSETAGATGERVPVLTVSQKGNLRQAFMAGSGWFRMTNNPDPAVSEWASMLIRNTLQWLSSNSSVDLLRFDTIEPGSENVILRARLINEAGEPEENANISLSLRSGNASAKRYNMEHEDRGLYVLNLGRLPEGRYQYAADANLGERLIQQTKGAFYVSKPSLELARTRRNDEVLKRLSASTSGFYLTHEQMQVLGDSLAAKGIFNSKTFVEQTNIYFFEQFWWFILIVGLLACEWGLRKWQALP